MNTNKTCPITCPKCKGKVWKAGKLVTARSGLKQRYVCTACGHIFLVVVDHTNSNNKQQLG
jgi:transposase-like protein